MLKDSYWVKNPLKASHRWRDGLKSVEERNTMLSYHNSTKQLVESNIDTAIISVGSTEQCGPYLPFHLDTLLYCALNENRSFGEVEAPILITTAV